MYKRQILHGVDVRDAEAVGHDAAGSAAAPRPDGDVLASLQQIMQQNTAAFQNDFDIDKKILTRAAKSKNVEDKVYL